ncbi:MAG: hypothetical protein NVS9B15_18830 [Acidobacteriaceae bacterium]
MSLLASTSTERQLGGRRYIARQSIVDRKCDTVGYELLYRRNRVNSAPVSEHPNPSQDTLDCSVLIGLDTLCSGRIAFFNCNREVLLGDHIRLLPANKVVLEILEDVVPDDEVLQACMDLKSLGFHLALDDFLPSPQNFAFLDYVDTLKLDFQCTTADRLNAVAREYADDFCMLAEKVETAAEFSRALEHGFHLVQGFLFDRPEVLSTRSVSPERLEFLRTVPEIMPQAAELYFGSELR